MIAFVDISDDPSAFDFLRVLEEARGGDQRAIEQLFERFYPPVERMVHKSLATDLRVNRPWLSTRFSTGDVVQEVFTSVLGDLGVFAGTNEGAFAGYLAMVVRNRILDLIRFHEAARRDGRRPSIDVVDAPIGTDSTDPARLAVSREEFEQFHAALAKLPERERLVLRARFERTASFQELADQLGYGSISSVRRAFFAAHAKLATLLGLDAGPSADSPEPEAQRED